MIAEHDDKSVVVHESVFHGSKTVDGASVIDHLRAVFRHRMRSRVDLPSLAVATLRPSASGSVRGPIRTRPRPSQPGPTIHPRDCGGNRGHDHCRRGIADPEAEESCQRHQNRHRPPPRHRASPPTTRGLSLSWSGARRSMAC